MIGNYKCKCISRTLKIYISDPSLNGRHLHVRFVVEISSNRTDRAEQRLLSWSKKNRIDFDAKFVKFTIVTWSAHELTIKWHYCHFYSLLDSFKVTRSLNNFHFWPWFATRSRSVDAINSLDGQRFFSRTSFMDVQLEQFVIWKKITFFYFTHPTFQN